MLVDKKEKHLKQVSEARRKMRLEEDKKEMTIEKLNQYQQYFIRLKANIKAQNKLINLVDEEIKLINERLIQARKQRRIIERLKENKLKQYMYDLQKEDQNFFDEVGNNSFIKKKIEDKYREAAKKVKEKTEIPIKYREHEPGKVEQLYEEIIQKGELLS